MSHITSRSAELASDTYAISVEYSGVIERQYITVGDTVKKGDKLLELKSSSLSDAIRLKQVDRSSLLYSLNGNGDIVLTAGNDGVVRTMHFLEGTYVPANSEIASIDAGDSRYVVSRYLLDAPDYARINRNTPVTVTLPDNQKLQAEVFDISMERDGERVYTVVKARFDKSTTIPSTFTSGTPVSVAWELESSSWYTTMLNFLYRLIQPRTQASLGDEA
ncbi:MAG: HlyD family efflux transporter periplasmic adaptor subunit [Candidatus Saccharimonadales bacterium]